MKINEILLESTRLDPKCWSGKKIGNPKTKMKGGVRVNNCVPKESVSEEFNEEFNDEYDGESSMAETNLHTIIRSAQGLLDTIDDNENLPEWVQEKIAKVEGMIVSSWDYLISQEEQGIDPRIEEDAKGYKSPSGGLTKKGRDHYNRTTGSNLKAPVTTKPSKLKPGSKSANRRKSFCARMGGVKGPMKDEKGKPTRKSLALKKWNC